MNTLKKSHTWLLLVVLVVSSLAQINADMYTPSFMSIAHSLSVSMNTIQMTLSLYLLSMAISQLFYGPMSEGIGRKSTLMIGVIINTLGAVICSHAHHMSTFTLGRIIQGIGVGATASLFRAVLRDCFSGDALSQVISYVANGMIAMTVAAPFLGGIIQQYGHWRFTFVFLTFYSIAVLLLIAFRFKETNTAHRTTRLNVSYITKSYLEILRSRLFIGYSLCVLLTYGGLFSWITAASPLLIKVAGIRPVTFGYLMLATALSTAMGSNLNALWVKRLGAKRLLVLGWCIMIAAGLLMMLLGSLFKLNCTIIMVPALLFIVGTALIWGNSMSLAFEPFRHMAGVAGAVYGCFQILGGALFAFALSNITQTSQFPVALMLTGSGVAALMSYAFIARPATAMTMSTTMSS